MRMVDILIVFMAPRGYDKNQFLGHSHPYHFILRSILTRASFFFLTSCRRLTLCNTPAPRYLLSKPPYLYSYLQSIGIFVTLFPPVLLLLIKDIHFPVHSQQRTRKATPSPVKRSFRAPLLLFLFPLISFLSSLSLLFVITLRMSVDFLIISHYHSFMSG